jgi:hypothetical protein
MNFSRQLKHIIIAATLALATTISTNPAFAEIVPPDIKKIVTFVFLSDANGNLLRDAKTNIPAANGTGFFVGINDIPRKGTFGYLVTAKHVLQNADRKFYKSVYLRLNRIEGDAEFVQLPLEENGQSLVYTHPDPTVDIAVVAALPSEVIFDFKVLSQDMISTKETFSEFQISEGTDVFFEGLFTQYYGDHKNIPIVRFGRVAMFPDQSLPWPNAPGGAPQNQQLYLFETQSYGGNSGSPVFFSLGSDRNPGSMVVGPPIIKLAGIMHGRYNEANPVLGVLQTPTAVSPITLPNVGIAAITPSYFLYEILFSADLKKFRASHPIH